MLCVSPELGVKRVYCIADRRAFLQILSREAVEAPSLETFKVRLDWALSNLIQLKMPLLIAVGLD